MTMIGLVSTIWNEGNALPPTLPVFWCQRLNVDRVRNGWVEMNEQSDLQLLAFHMENGIRGECIPFGRLRDPEAAQK